MRCRLVVVLFVLFRTCVIHAGTNKGDFTFVYADDNMTLLPRCPKGCEIIQYRHLANLVTIKPAPNDQVKRKRTWKEFFAMSGIVFPKGGFVVYDPHTNVCTVATTPEEIDLILNLVSH